MALNDFKKAEYFSDKALSLNRHSYTAMHIKGFISSNNFNFNEAIDYFLKALALTTYNAEIIRSLLWVFVKSGDIIRAIDLIEKHKVDFEISNDLMLCRDLEILIAQDSDDFNSLIYLYNLLYNNSKKTKYKNYTTIFRDLNDIPSKFTPRELGVG